MSSTQAYKAQKQEGTICSAATDVGMLGKMCRVPRAPCLCTLLIYVIAATKQLFQFALIVCNLIRIAYNYHQSQM